MSEDKKVTKKTSISKKASSKKEVTKKPIKKEVKKEVKKEIKKEVKKGKYVKAVGRRKTAVAQVRLYYPGKGEFLINDKNVFDVLSEDNFNIILQPLKACSKVKDFDFSVIVRGGGVSSQVEAVRHGVSRAIFKYDPELKVVLKVGGFLTRDPRKKERKKPGLKKARKAPQWSKR